MGRATVAVTILLLVVVAMGLVLLSSLALPALDSDGQTDWGRLSDIGQTYGAVSAVVAAIALIGVMVSLVIQGREMKQARKNARRALHVELMRMAMDDPSYMEVWGPYDTDTFAAERQQTYVNLIVAHWYAEYEVGEMPDVLLRATAAEVFAGVPGRRYWNDVGRFWRDNYSGRRARRFHQVLEETYQDAIKKPPVLPPPGVERGPEPDTEPAREPNPSRPDRWVSMLAAAAGGGAVALVVARAVRRALRR